MTEIKPCLRIHAAGGPAGSTGRRVQCAEYGGFVQRQISLDRSSRSTSSSIRSYS